MVAGLIIGIVVGIVVGVLGTCKCLIWYTKKQMKSMTKEDYIKEMDVGAEAIGAKFKNDPTQSAMNAWDEYRNQDSFDA